MTEQNMTATSELLQQANAGNAKAQFELALCYVGGKGIEQSKELSLEWTLKSAEQGYLEAQFALGLYHLWGVDTRIQFDKFIMQGLIFTSSAFDLSIGLARLDKFKKGNPKLAFKWFSQAAKQHHAESYHCLGMCYKNSWGTESNAKFEFSSFKKSAELDFSDAYYPLAYCYYHAIGTEKNDELAFSWATKAVDKSNFLINPMAYILLGDLYGNGEGIQQNAQQALKCYEKVAARGEDNKDIAYAKAKNRLAYCYEKGKGVEQSIQLANEYYAEADKYGAIDANAQFRMANYYLKGQSVEKDVETGIDWMISSIHAGGAEADQFFTNALLAIIVPTELLGKGKDEQYYEYIFNWCIQNKEGHNQPEVYFFLGLQYYAGQGVEQNDKLAFQYFKQSYDSYYNINRDCYTEGDAFMHSLVNIYLSICYALGKGVKRKSPKTEGDEELMTDGIFFTEGVSILYKENYHIKTFIILLRMNLFKSFKEYDMAIAYINETFEKLDGAEKSFQSICLSSIEQNRNLDKQNQALEEKNQELSLAEKELEDMMSMFAHKFRSPLDAILYNTNHENNPKLYIEAAQSMRGLLDIFSLISTDDKILKQRIMADSIGENHLSDLFSHSLDMLLLHFLSVSGAEKIRQHYISYAKAHQLCDAGVSLKLWNEDYFELEHSLQSEWEQSYAKKIITTDFFVYHSTLSLCFLMIVVLVLA